MIATERDPANKKAAPARESAPGWPTWLVLAFALVFPSVMAWIDFVVVPSGNWEASAWSPIAYPGGKIVQFSLPVVFVLVTTGRLPRPARPNLRGISLGVAFGLLTALGVIVLYFIFLRDSEVFRHSPGLVKAQLVRFGLDSRLGFAAIALFICVVHSLLEEYYWRWFVFGQLRRLVGVPSAMALSSLFFAGFHAFLLNLYLPGHLFTAVLLFVLCIAVGGAVWAWLYERTGSIYAGWLSHLLVDASLFVVGYDLLFVRGN